MSCVERRTRDSGVLQEETRCCVTAVTSNTPRVPHCRWLDLYEGVSSVPTLSAPGRVTVACYSKKTTLPCDRCDLACR